MSFASEWQRLVSARALAPDVGTASQLLPVMVTWPAACLLAWLCACSTLARMWRVNVPGSRVDACAGAGCGDCSAARPRQGGASCWLAACGQAARVHLDVLCRLGCQCRECIGALPSCSACPPHLCQPIPGHRWMPAWSPPSAPLGRCSTATPRCGRWHRCRLQCSPVAPPAGSLASATRPSPLQHHAGRAARASLLCP